MQDYQMISELESLRRLLDAKDDALSRLCQNGSYNSKKQAHRLRQACQLSLSLLITRHVCFPKAEHESVAGHRRH